jgi:hypothetical protein
MRRKSVETRFDCGHVSDVSVRLDADVEVPAEVRGLGKCRECMEEEHLQPIPGIQPTADGTLKLDSIFLIPVE